MLEKPHEELPRGAKAPIQCDCADHRLEGSCQHAVARALARPLARAEVEVCAEVDLSRPTDESFGAHESHPPPGELPFVGIGIERIEVLGSNRAKDRVSQELEALVRQGGGACACVA